MKIRPEKIQACTGFEPMIFIILYLRFLDARLVIANSVLGASLAIYHFIYPTRANGIIVSLNPERLDIWRF